MTRSLPSDAYEHESLDSLWLLPYLLVPVDHA
jgi:hypothetical protein